MSNEKRFVVKHGLQSQNMEFVSPDKSKRISVSMLDAGTISFSGDSGELFSVTDTMSGTIFAVNDISGIPSLEIDDDGIVRIAESVGNVLIGTTVDNGNKLQVSGSASVSGNLTVGGDLTVSGNTTVVNTTNLTVEDSVITLNSGQSTPLNDIGMLFQRYATPDATNYNVGFAWDEASDSVILGKTAEVGNDNDITFTDPSLSIQVGTDAGGKLSTTKDIIEMGFNYNISVKALKFQRQENKAAIWSVPVGSFGRADIRFTTGDVSIGTAKTEADAVIRIAPAGGLVVGNSYLTQNPADGNLIVSGNVGIGTTSPSRSLDVSGQARISSVLTMGSYIQGTTQLDLYGDSTSSLGVRIASTGNVGIGTTSPSAKLDLAETWNNVATTFTHIKSNVTDTASAAGSLLMDLQVSGVSRFNVTKGGQLVFPRVTGGEFIALANEFYVGAGGGVTISKNLPSIRWADISGVSINNTDLVLTRDAANTLAQRNSTTAQTSRVYNTYTDASNYERAKIGWNANVLEIGTENAGTGTLRNISLIGGNVGIGTSTPAYKLDVDGIGRISSTSASTLLLYKYNSAAPTINMFAANGTKDSPTQTLSGDVIGGINMFGYGPTGFSGGPSVRIRGIAVENNGTTVNRGSDLIFETVSLGGVTIQERMRITANGDIGIGTSTPAHKLQVNGTASANNIIITGSLSADGSIGTNGQSLRSDGTKAYWSSAGSTYISSTPPLNPLEGDFWWDTDVAQLFIYYFDGSSFQWVQANRDILIEGPVGTYTLPGNLIATDVSVLGTLTETSDEKLKTNVATIKNPIDTAKKLRGVMFNWKDGGEESMGLIAQEVEQILPFLVSTQENGIKTLHYTAIIGLLIEAIKELSDKVDNK